LEAPPYTHPENFNNMKVPEILFSGDHKKIVKYLNENQKNKRGRNNCWKDYVRAFDYNHNHPVIQKLKKKIIQYLPNAEIGKPYRNKDWINY
jgi:tRNA G37 N-methylase TrmD